VDTLAPGSYEILEHICFDRHLTGSDPVIRHLDEMAAGSFLYSKLVRVRWTGDERTRIAQIERAIAEETGVRIDLARLFAEEIKHFRFSFRYYSRLLARRRPRRIFVVVSYSYYKRALIAAAKARGIETIELQHGTLSPYHLGYSFPGRDRELDYFPAGDYWNTACEFPLPADRIKTWGFPHFVRQRARYGSLERSGGQLLFISQGVIGKRLAHFALDCARRLPDRRLVYKLHPGEQDRWRSDYPELVEASRLRNVEVVDDNTRNLHAYFAESQHVVGVFSTAIYEGLAFGCRTFVVDLPGIEYMSDLIARGIVTKVESVADLEAGLTDRQAADFDSDFFFAPGPTAGEIDR
jgi:hypothetical protein